MENVHEVVAGPEILSTRYIQPRMARRKDNFALILRFSISALVTHCHCVPGHNYNTASMDK